jgi:hypothetical protein
MEQQVGHIDRHRWGGSAPIYSENVIQSFQRNQDWT